MLEYEYRNGDYYYRCVIGGKYYALGIHVGEELELYENEFDLLPVKVKKVSSGILRAVSTRANGDDREVRNPV